MAGLTLRTSPGSMPQARHTLLLDHRCNTEEGVVHFFIKTVASWAFGPANLLTGSDNGDGDCEDLGQGTGDSAENQLCRCRERRKLRSRRKFGRQAFDLTRAHERISRRRNTRILENSVSSVRITVKIHTHRERVQYGRPETTKEPSQALHSRAIFFLDDKYI